MIFVVLALASLLRLYNLGGMPTSLYWEEAALGYDAYSLWMTGKDYHGNPWPVVAFESFGDYKPSGYFYIAAPFVGILGLNNWAIRLPSALAGIVTVYLVYLISLDLFKKKAIALWAAFVLAILPWHIQFSRAAFEVNLATMWLVVGVFFLLKAKIKPAYISFGTLAFVAAAYTYHGLRVTGPLMALTLVCLSGKKLLKSPWLWISGVLAGLLMFPILINLSNPAVNQRFNETSLFSTSNTVAITNQLRQEDENKLIYRVIHHRYTYWGKEILNGVLAHFSPNFLFLKGDSNQRHQTGYTGLLYLWQVIPIVAALLCLGKQEKKPWIIVGFWVSWAALPAALTNVTPHTLRFLPAAPAFAMVIGYGLNRLYQQKQKIFKLVLGGWIVIETVFYLFDYSHSYLIRSEFEWQVGYQQMVNYVSGIKDKYSQIQVTRAYGRPSIYFLFYGKIDPLTIQSVDSILPKDQGELLAFDKFVFGLINPNIPSLVVSEKALPSGLLIKTISSQDNRPIFYIYEI